jgi:type II secretory ATPase GspE/PulE/Tfp pilus assembly ATPase PilB-like protein
MEIKKAVLRAARPETWPVSALNTPEEVAAFLEETRELKLLSADGGELYVNESDRHMVAAFSNGPLVIADGYRDSVTVKSLLDLHMRKNTPLAEKIVMVPPEAVSQVYAARNAQDTDRASEMNEQQKQTELRLLITKAAQLKASDIHIRTVGSGNTMWTEIRVRVNGRLRDTDVTTDDGMALMRAAMAVATDQNTRGTDMTSQQGTLTPKTQLLPQGVDLIRLQYVPTSDNKGALIMRLKYQGGGAKSDLGELGYSEHHLRDLQVMRRRTNGLYLSAGKVSSGKSTTLERVINRMQREKSREISVFTIEEPVELQIPGAVQMAISSSDDKDRGAKMASAMRDALRSDPNVIVVGEMRDERTAGLGIHAAETGHALWSTIHAGSALGILDRLESLDVQRWKIADPSIVRGLFYQRLVGVLCPECRINYNDAVKNGMLDRELAKSVMTLTGRAARDLFIRNPKGCEHCDMGMVGRTVVAETIVTDAQLLQYFLEGKRSEMRAYWTRPRPQSETDLPGMGGHPVLHHALSKVGAGIVDINEVEEEVDLVEVYEREYRHLIPRLKKDIEHLVDVRDGRATGNRSEVSVQATPRASMIEEVNLAEIEALVAAETPVLETAE